MKLRLLVLIALLLIAAACGKGAGTPTPTPHEEPEHVAEGRQLFVAKGCAVCHGREGEGTTIAPVVAGHSAAIVKRQVRSPRFQMPAFGPSQVSDAELDKIAEFIESLGPAVAHVEPTAMPGLMAMHHWMAILALDAHDAREAKHHVEHILELVQEQEHRHQMEEVMELLAKEDLHEAGHRIENMLVGAAVFGLTLDTLYLQLALQALELKDFPDLKHHLEHFRGQAPAHLKVKAQEMIELFEQQKLHELEEELGALLGVTRHR